MSAHVVNRDVRRNPAPVGCARIVAFASHRNGNRA